MGPSGQIVAGFVSLVAVTFVSLVAVTFVSLVVSFTFGFEATTSVLSHFLLVLFQFSPASHSIQDNVSLSH